MDSLGAITKKAASREKLWKQAQGRWFKNKVLSQGLQDKFIHITKDQSNG